MTASATIAPHGDHHETVVLTLRGVRYGRYVGIRVSVSVTPAE
jgi:hypothetical protein